MTSQSFPPPPRQLRRSRTDRKIAGVCGGIAEYLHVDPTVIRLAFIVLAVLTGGAFLIAYLVAALVMPDTPAPAPVWTAATGQPFPPSTPPVG